MRGFKAGERLTIRHQGRDWPLVVKGIWGISGGSRALCYDAEDAVWLAQDLGGSVEVILGPLTEDRVEALAAKIMTAQPVHLPEAKQCLILALSVFLKGGGACSDA